MLELRVSERRRIQFRSRFYIYRFVRREIGSVGSIDRLPTSIRLTGIRSNGSVSAERLIYRFQIGYGYSFEFMSAGFLRTNFGAVFGQELSSTRFTTSSSVQK